MDPIKVDFSEKGKKKKNANILIPPEKAGLKMVINVLVMLIVAVVAYYFMLPPMNPQAYKFYAYWLVVLGSFAVSAYVTSGAFAKPEYVPYVRRRSIVPAALAAVFVVVLGVGWLVSSPFFRAKSYSKILTISDADFSGAVSLIDSMSDFNNVALIDTDTAFELANNTLGDFAKLNLESQFELLTEDSTQINYKGSPYRIYPLKYGDIFKWFLNSVANKTYEGIPGYVAVNLNTQQAKLITDYDIKYSTAEHFGEYLERVLRFKYPTKIFGEISFEIDETGKPFWVVEDIKKTIGLVGGDDVQGIFLVDAETGDANYYTAEEVGAADSPIVWIDQAYDSNLLVTQYNYFGKYDNGFWNSLIGQSGVKKASDGYSFITNGDDVYMYTGVTSVTGDDSILGFVLINQRTKEALFYSTTGATELKAQDSAKGKVQDKGWTASFPILLNIDGEATYFMSLKDEGNVVKSYAMVNVEQRNLMAIPKNENMDLRSCLEEYIRYLGELTPPKIIEFNFDADQIGETEPDNETNQGQSDLQTMTGTVTDIRTAVVGGTTYYYIELNGSGTYYYVAATVMNRVVLLDRGDTVTVTAAAKGAAENLFAVEDIGFGAAEPASGTETAEAETAPAEAAE